MVNFDFKDNICNNVPFQKKKNWMVEVDKKKRKIDGIYVKVNMSNSSKGQLLYLEVLGKLI